MGCWAGPDPKLPLGCCLVAERNEQLFVSFMAALHARFCMPTEAEGQGRPARRRAEQVGGPGGQALTDEHRRHQLGLSRPARKLRLPIDRAGLAVLVPLGQWLHGYLRAVGERRARGHRRPRHRRGVHGLVVVVRISPAVPPVGLALQAGGGGPRR